MPLSPAQVEAEALVIHQRMQLPDTDPNFLSREAGRAALFSLADQLDVSVPQGAAVIFYSGDFRDLANSAGALSSHDFAEAIHERANTGGVTRVVTIDHLPFGQVMGDEESAFRAALLYSVDGDPALANDLLYGSRGSSNPNPVAVGDSLFGRGSARLAAGTTGPSFSLTGHGTSGAVWSTVEVGALLDNPNGGTINGISRQDLLNLRVSGGDQAVVNLLNGVSGVSSVRGVQFQTQVVNSSVILSALRVEDDFFTSMGVIGIPHIDDAPGQYFSLPTVRLRENATYLAAWMEAIESAPPEIREELLSRPDLRESMRLSNQALTARANRNIDLTGASTFATVFVLSGFAATLFEIREAVAEERGVDPDDVPLDDVLEEIGIEDVSTQDVIDFGGRVALEAAGEALIPGGIAKAGYELLMSGQDVLTGIDLWAAAYPENELIGDLKAFADAVRALPEYSTNLSNAELTGLIRENYSDLLETSGLTPADIANLNSQAALRLSGDGADIDTSAVGPLQTNQSPSGPGPVNWSNGTQTQSTSSLLDSLAAVATSTNFPVSRSYTGIDLHLIQLTSDDFARFSAGEAVNVRNPVTGEMWSVQSAVTTDGPLEIYDLIGETRQYIQRSYNVYDRPGGAAGDGNIVRYIRAGAIFGDVDSFFQSQSFIGTDPEGDAIGEGGLDLVEGEGGDLTIFAAPFLGVPDGVFSDSGDGFFAAVRNGVLYVVRGTADVVERVVGGIRAALTGTYMSFESVGSILGAQLMRALPVENAWARIGVSTALGTLLSNVGRALDTHFAVDSNISLLQAFETSFADLPQDILSNGLGSISTYLIGDLLAELDMDPETAEAVNAFAGPTMSRIAYNIVHAGQAMTRASGGVDYFVNGSGEWVDFAGNPVSTPTVSATGNTPPQSALRTWDSGIAVSFFATVAAVYLGSKLADSIVEFETVEGQVGAAVGEAIGGIIAGKMLIAAFNPVTFIAAVVVVALLKILGGALGSLFGGTPKAGAELTWDATEQRYDLGRVWSKNGGSRDAVQAMALNVSALLNAVIDLSGSRVLDPSSIRVGAYDLKGSRLIYKPSLSGSYAFSSSDFSQVVNHGAFIALSDLSDQLVGGDVYVKRALLATIEQSGGDPSSLNEYAAGDFSADLLFGNLSTAQDFSRYMTNSAAITALIQADPESVFAATWAIALSRALDLGLNKRASTDWLGGWAAYLDGVTDGVLDGEAIGPGNVILDLSSQSYKRSVIFMDADGVFLGVRGDTVDSDSKTVVQGTSGADVINASHGNWQETRIITEAVQVDADRRFFNTQDNTSVQIAHDDVYNGQPVALGAGLVLVSESTVEVTRQVTIQRNGWRIEDASGLSFLNRDAEGGPAFEAMTSGPSGQIRVAAHIDGGAGNDTIRGGDLGNDLLGGQGNDTLVGGALDDWQFGGDGNDRLFAGDVPNVSFSDTATDSTNETARNIALGNVADGQGKFVEAGNGDYLDGGAGADALYGGRGSDWLNGGDGVDILRAGDGGDILDGGAGDDRGASGEAHIFGGAGSDQYIFYFGAGNDVIFDASSPSTVAGANLYGAYARFNSLIGNPGARNWAGNGEYEVDGSVVGGEDAIAFGTGVGFENLRLKRGMTGGVANSDLIIELVDEEGDPTGDTLTIKDWFDETRRVEWFRFADGQDIRIGDISSFTIGPNVNNSIVGTDGADWAVGLSDDDDFKLLGGDDFGFGGKGADTISGDGDNDFISGGDDADTVLGGDGNDTVLGDAGNDTVDGGGGNDILAGGRGDDRVIGGTGNDLYRYWRGDGADTIFDSYASGVTEEMRDENGNWINGYYEQNGLIYYNSQVLFDGEQWSVGLDWNVSTGRLTRRILTQGQPITANSGFDTLEFGFGIDIEDVQVRRIGGDLVIAIGGDSLEGAAFGSIGDRIVLSEHFSTGAQIERFVFTEIGALDIGTWAIAADANGVTSSDGDDTIAGGAGVDWFTGGLGDDVISGAGGEDILSGNAGDDDLEGGDGADIIYGGAGNDVIEGGAGADQIYGGAGEDIASYTANTTGIRVSLQHQFVNTLEARGDVLVGIEALEGGSGADKLYGDALDNVLRGNAGNDVLKGSGGDDTYEINANQGDDTIAESNISIVEIIDANGQLAAGYTAIWELDDIEDLWGVYWYRYKLTVKDSSNNTIYQSNFNDFKYTGPVGEAPAPSSWPFSNGQWVSGVYRTGNSVQTVREIAGAGDAGRDAVEFGAGISLSELTAARQNSGADLAISIAGGGSVTIIGQSGADSRVEDLILRDGLSANLGNLRVGSEQATAADDLYLGDASANTFAGGAGDDTVSGGGGNDTLSGGDGDDTLEGGAGGDTLEGGADSITANHTPLAGDTTRPYGDTIRYVSSNAGVTVNLQNQTATGGHATGDTITGIENVVGSAHNDSLTGSSGANRLSGLGGDDTLVGGSGDDILIGGDGNDHINGGDGDDGISGDAGADIIYAGAGNDIVSGGDGADVIHADAGADQVTGDVGDDEIWGGADNDNILGGDGEDELYGEAGDDMLAGEAGDDLIYGGDGADTLAGGGGDDTLRGEGGDDAYAFDANSGADIVIDAAGQNNSIAIDGVSFEQIWLVQSGTDLVISVVGGSSQITVKDYFATSNATLMRSIVTGTHTLFLGGAAPLIAAMTAAGATPAESAPSSVSDLFPTYWHLGEKSAPQLADQSLTTNEDTALTGSVGAVDHDGETMSYAVNSGPAHGSLSLNAATGAWTYTPNANWNGADRFTIAVTDESEQTTIQHVDVNVAAVNDAPVITTETFSVAENSANGTQVGTITTSDVEGHGVTFTQQSDAGGRFAVSSSGVITVINGASVDFEGASSHQITVTATDAGGASLGTRQITINLTDVNEAPTALDLLNQVVSLAENTSTSTRVKVADLALSDDALGSETLALSGADAASFEIFEGGLYLRAGVTLNFEAKQSYAVTVSADDATVGDTPDVSRNYTLSITDVNEAPNSIAFANETLSLAEATSTAVRIKVADIVIADDAMGTENITLAGVDASSFEIVDGALYLKAGVALDYEAKSSYSVNVNVDDPTLGSGAEAILPFELSITDGNEAPQGLSLTNKTTTIAENASTATRTKVADIVVNDDALGTLVYSLSGPDAAAFEIIGSELFLKANVALNYEAKTSYAVTVEVDDPALGSTFELSEEFALFVTDVNEAPTNLQFANEVTTLAENTSTASRIKVADLSYSDDALGSESYALSGPDHLSFEIIGSSLYLRAGVTLNYEAKSSYSVTVDLNDPTVGNSPDTSRTFNLSISNVNEAPTALDLVNQVATLAENTSTASRIKVADISLSDDGLGSESFTLAGDDPSAFEIIGGALYLRAGVTLDYETKNSYSVIVQADDATVGASPDVSKSFVLTLTNVNEAPYGLSIYNATTVLAENTSTGSAIKVADLSYSDDALGSESYGLSGADASSFHIVGAALYLNAGVTLDYESKTSYSVTVTVDDASIGGGAELQQGFTLYITDVNEAPSALSLTNQVTSLAENTSTASAIKVADLVLSDDALGAESWTLSGTDHTSFEIVGGALYLKAGVTLNYEAKTSYAVTVSADDTSVGGTPDASQNFTLSVTNVNEAPVVSPRTRNSNGAGTPGLFVGTSTVTDPDGPGTITWSIVSVTGSGGAGIGSYSINASTGQLYCQYNTGGWRTSDFVTVRATDAGGLYSQAMVTLNYDNDQPWPPIVFDLDGDGIELVSAEASGAEFDVNGDGILDDTGWVGADDAFLALDRDGDGLITRGEEIAFTHDADGAASDLEGLSSYDTNGDGFFSADDAQFGEFRLWQDVNQDGVAQSGELTTLAERNIVAVNLTLTLTGQTPENLTDNVLYGTASYVRADGSVGTVGDVFLAYMPGEETGSLPPIVFDLDGGGIALTSRTASNVMFDADSDGEVQRIGWFGPGEGVLALDRNGDGAIGSGAEISFARDVEGARTDLEGLTAYDSNQNGFFDEGDQRFGEFRIWQDANQDGVSQSEELRTLAEWDIRAVNLTPTLTGASIDNASDNVLYATSEFVRSGGVIGLVGDVVLSYTAQSGGDAMAGAWCPDDLLRPHIENTKSGAQEDAGSVNRTADNVPRPRQPTRLPQSPFSWIDEREIHFDADSESWSALEPARRMWRNRRPLERVGAGTGDDEVLTGVGAPAPTPALAGDAGPAPSAPSQLHRGLSVCDRRILHMIDAMAAFDAQSASDLARTGRTRDPKVAAMLTALPDLR